MASDYIGRIGVLWRGNRDARDRTTAENNRLRPLFEAFADLRVAAEPVVYSDEMVDEVRDQLQQLDGVLVWVDPIVDGQDRSKLDALLREVSSAGVRVSAHPDVILRMGTKEVLFRTRDLGWGADVHLYTTVQELREQFSERMASAGPRVLKQHRGNGGIGVWKVELIADASVASGADGAPPAPGAGATVRVQHARSRDSVTEDMRLSEFIDRCAQYFFGSGRMVDQPFQPRIAEGMIRCYMIEDELIGFAHQWPEGLTQKPDEGAVTAGLPPANILGLPSKKTMYGASEPSFRALRAKVESDWVPGMQRLLEIDTNSLPVIWDADFLYGPKTEAGEDTYVLCEINVSSVYPFPEEAVGRIAQATVTRMLSTKRSSVRRR